MTPYTCIKPQCHPQKCSDCNCAISPTDDAAHVILELLNTFAVCGHGHPFEDGDSAVVDKARSWLQAARRAPVVPQRCDLCKNNGGYFYGRTGYEPCCVG